MLSDERKKTLFKQGYRFAGKHSAVKTCLWCRKSITNQGFCYKQSFYGIQSHRCIQMSPVLDLCNLRCKWCWRDVSYAEKSFTEEPEPAREIIDACIAEHKTLLMGFKGFHKTGKKKFQEAMNPKHFAISLVGEPTLFPKLPELVKEISSRGMTSFIVTNGTRPEMLKKLLKQKPTQLYITLPAPNEKVFKESCNPLEGSAWESILKSLSLLKKFPRSAARLTLARSLNMRFPEQYAALLSSAKPSFVEVKAFMSIGLSRKRLSYDRMPLHPEIREFAEKINNSLGYSFIAEQPASRVALLWDNKTGQKIKI